MNFRFRGRASSLASVARALPLLSAMMCAALPALATPKPKPARRVRTPVTPKLPAASTASTGFRASGEYLLGPDDELKIEVSNHPDLNTAVKVRPDGKITLPRAGEIMARGQSVPTLARIIEARLARTLNHASVQVFLTTPRPRLARIIGAVKSTGTYPLQSGAHVLDLIAQAGGLTSKPTRIVGRVVRSGQVIPFDIGRAVAEPSSNSNVALHLDDVVELDALDYTKQITVMGAVKSPGAYDLDEGLTVMGLLARAGGPLDSAALRKAQILRRGQPVLSDLSAAARGSATPGSDLANFLFEPGDVLNVPENTQRFGVEGQVLRPAYYLFPENAADATVLKVLSQAGGPLPDSDLEHATITHSNGNKSEATIVNVALMLAGRAPDNVLLQENDVLYLPKRIEHTISVIGPVAKPGIYPLGPGSTLLSVIAEAGNPIEGAGLSRAYVLRGGVQMPVNLHSAIVDRQVTPEVADFKLQDNDKVVIPDMRGQVQVMGQVAKPGAYNLDDDLTVMSLLSKSGGPLDSAALRHAYVVRGGQHIDFDLNSTVAGLPDPAVASFHFLPGDQLVLPQNQLRIAVLGQVNRPNYYPFPENAASASVLTALSAAGGPTQLAGLNHAGILRTVNGTSQVIPVDIDKLFRGGGTAQNVLLQPNDVLYVPLKKQSLKITDFLGPLALFGGKF